MNGDDSQNGNDCEILEENQRNNVTVGMHGETTRNYRGKEVRNNHVMIKVRGDKSIPSISDGNNSTLALGKSSEVPPRGQQVTKSNTLFNQSNGALLDPIFLNRPTSSVNNNIEIE